MTLIDLVLSKTDLSNRSTNESPILQLSVYPNAGASTEKIEVRCEIAQPTSISPLSSSKFENVFLSVKTDHVKPSGILLMFDDTADGCRRNRDNIYIDFCNASLILIHISHTILNETLEKIDYECLKGSTAVMSSYRIKKDQYARYYDPIYNSSSCLAHTSLLLLFVIFVIRIIKSKIKWS
ncbi:unnamed protein product [Rotaria sp. Silwood2]|nr:unnamed protein product [Rotaria sp. Silwood2]CAF2529945.1 unnamed protein product [Rotaria sp. Silwood2]CAF2764729.1 unnamed protein product [Rotaria sp. Silwood2]CAF2941899.1 unnamed protein product [Rotaria sp. Silwood2]CAF4032317.1 unnamed protein product [Rotaria sp. Silwood2]